MCRSLLWEPYSGIRDLSDLGSQRSNNAICFKFQDVGGVLRGRRHVQRPTVIIFGEAKGVWGPAQTEKKSSGRGGLVPLLLGTVRPEPEPYRGEEMDKHVVS